MQRNFFKNLSNLSNLLLSKTSQSVAKPSISSYEFLHVILNKKGVKERYDFPAEMHESIFNFLANPGLINLLAVNREWNAIVLGMLENRFPLLRNDHLTLPLNLKSGATPTGFSAKAFSLMAADLKRAEASSKSRGNNYSRTTIVVANSSGVLSWFGARTRKETIVYEADRPTGNHIRALFQAVRFNKQEDVKKHFSVLRGGKFSVADILNFKNRYDQTVLDIAALCGSVAALDFFIQQNCLITNETFFTLLNNAAANNQTKMIGFIFKTLKEALAEGCFLIISDPEFVLILMHAVLFKQYAAMQLLLEYGVPPHKVIALAKDSVIPGVLVKRVPNGDIKPQYDVQSPLTLGVDLIDMRTLELMFQHHKSEYDSQWWRNWAESWAENREAILLTRSKEMAQGHEYGGIRGYYDFKGYCPIHYILNRNDFDLLKYFLGKDKELVNCNVDFWYCDGGTKISFYTSVPLKKYPFQGDDIRFFVQGFSALVNARSNSAVDIRNSIIALFSQTLKNVGRWVRKHDPKSNFTRMREETAIVIDAGSILFKKIEFLKGLNVESLTIENLYHQLDQVFAEANRLHDIVVCNDITLGRVNTIEKEIEFTILGAKFYIEAHVLAQNPELEVADSVADDAKSESAFGKRFK